MKPVVVTLFGRSQQATLAVERLMVALTQIYLE